MTRSSNSLPGKRPFVVPPSGAPLTWVLQAIVFLIGGPPLAFPSLVLDSFLGKAPPAGEPLRFAYDSFAILAVHAVSIGLLTVYALVSGLPWARRAYAGAFAFFTGSWGLVVVINLFTAPDLYTWHTTALLVPAAIFFFGNLRAALRPLATVPDRYGLGDAASAPPWATPAWLALAAAAGLGGVAIFLTPATFLGWVARDPAEVTPLAIAQIRFSGPYLIGYAALCVFALRTERVEVWRALATVLAIWPAGAILLSLARMDPFAYTPTAYVLLIPFFVAFAVNVVILRGHVVPWEADISARLPGWTPSDLVAGPMMGAQTMSNRRRASHLFGVGARGRFILSPTRPIPNLFFDTPGEKEVVLRFANLSEEDDASLDVRGASISLRGDGPAARFDMVMNTGSAAPVYDLWSFAMFVGSKFLPAIGTEFIVSSNRVLREGAVLGVRRAPPSYAALRYHSQIVRWWFEPQGRLNLVRYRLVPDDLADEPGLADVTDAIHVWERGRLPGESRPINYLRNGLKEALRAGPVRLRLQAQFHPGRVTSDMQWYDASVAWDEYDHPWHDLGQIELTEALSDAETERLDFNPLHRPPGLGIPPSTGPWDRRSLGDSEVRVMFMLQRLRRWLDGRYGLPGGGA